MFDIKPTEQVPKGLGVGDDTEGDDKQDGFTSSGNTMNGKIVMVALVCLPNGRSLIVDLIVHFFGGSATNYGELYREDGTENWEIMGRWARPLREDRF